MKKYLIVTEKPSMVRSLESVYKQMGESAEFEADFLPVNCHVVNVKTSKLSADSIADHRPFNLKAKKVTPNFKLHCGADIQIARGEEILKMVKTNKYDAIINACDPDDEGDLEFQYMLESLGLERHKTERIYLFDLSDSLIESELMTLNDF